MSQLDEVGLGRQLQDARKRAGLTQQELCQRANLSYSTLAKIERGAIKAPSVFTIQSIAAALGTTLSALMGEAAPVVAVKKRSRSGVRFVYFDINGCLVRFYQRAFTRISQDLGVSADIVESNFWHYNDAICRGEMTMNEFNATLAKQFRVDTFDWTTYYLEALDPIPEMHELASWAANYYHVGLLSNIMPGLIDELKKRKLIPDLPYHTIIDSSQVGAIKPEQQIYEIASQRTGVKPEEILLIDDSRSNLMAAERMGWRVIWFDDYRPQESEARVRTALEPEADAS